MADGHLVRALAGIEGRRCPTCRTKIVVPEPDGLVVKNAILRVSAKTGRAAAKCPRCKSWVEVPLDSTGVTPNRAGTGGKSDQKTKAERRGLHEPRPRLFAFPGPAAPRRSPEGGGPQ